MNDTQIEQYMKDLADDLEVKGLAMIATVTSAEAERMHSITHNGEVVAEDVIGVLVIALLQNRAKYTPDDLNDIARAIAKASLPDYPLPRAH